CLGEGDVAELLLMAALVRPSNTFVAHIFESRYSPRGFQAAVLADPASASCRTRTGRCRVWPGYAFQRTARELRRLSSYYSCPASVSSFPCYFAADLSPWRPPHSR